MANPELQYDDNVTLTLSTLGATTVIATNSKIDSSRASGFRIIKSKIFAQFTGKTAAEGPVMFGVAIGYTAAEVEAILEQDPQSRVAAIEKGKGYIEPIGMVPLEAVAGPVTGPTGGSGAHAGMFETTPNWSCPEGASLSYWAYNMGSGALTTGTLFRVFAQHYGVWLRD